MPDELKELVEAVLWERECDECGYWLSFAWFANERLDQHEMYDIYVCAQNQVNLLVEKHAQ